MNSAEALVAISGMITCVLITCGIAWGVVQSKKHQQGGRLADSVVEGELVALREQMEHLQQQLVEAHERIDFTERLRSQVKGLEQLPRGQ